MRIIADDGTPIAVHHLAGTSGRPRVLFSHATGFHAHCYLPVARALSDRYECLGMDHRGHGSSPAPDGWSVDWRTFGDDARLVAGAIAHEPPLVGVGHSMGGAALLMAAHQRPELFERLVLFEPIVIKLDEATSIRTADEMAAMPIVQGALRRRRRFADVEEAIANYRTKPPLALMTPESLRCYVDHGFVATPDGEIELACTPEHEAAVFMGSRLNGVWDLLPAIDVPTHVVAGVIDPDQPSRWAAEVADRLPRGQLTVLDHQTHFGPMSHPEEFAELIAG